MVSFPGMVQGYFGHYDSKLEAQPLGRVSLQLGLAGPGLDWAGQGRSSEGHGIGRPSVILS